VIDINVTGLDNLQKTIRNLENKAKELEDGKDVPFEELFHPEFMQTYTEFGDIEAFIISSGLIDGKLTPEKFEELDEIEFDEWVSQKTSFDNWNTMYEKAGQAWMAKHLGFD
jgi:hypothetical protein